MNPESWQAQLLAQLAAIREELVEIKVTQAKHNVSLEEHMRRSDALEKYLHVVQSEVSPIKAHVAMWAGAGKLVVVVAAVVGILGTIWKLLGH